MISGFLRWLSLSFCLLLSWSLLAVPQTLLPQPALNKKRSGAPSTPLMTGGVQPVLARTPLNLWNAVPVIHRRAQRAKPKILAVPVGRLAPPTPVWTF